MTPERWQQIEKSYHAALERAPEERAAFLAQVCAADEALRREVESLLASHDEAGTFIDKPPDDVVAGMLTEEPAHSMIGRTLGHYRISSLLGAGGMGEVYLAQDIRLGRKVALKLLLREFMQDRERVRRFQQEARAASSLNHPNILTIFEIGQVDDLHFIATEFIEGQTLRERLRSGPLKLRDAVEIATQVSSAFSAAHEAGIAHRDIKPENVMVRRDGYVKVLDFGLAKLFEPFRADSTTIVGSETSSGEPVRSDTGKVVGTPRYMSPEQIRSQPVDGRSDIFSLGVVIYEMVTEHAPFEATTPLEVVAAILNAEPPPLERYARAIPAEMERIVSKMLAKDREERYQTARDLLIDLRNLKLELELEVKRSRIEQPEAGSGTKRTRSVEGQVAEPAPGVVKQRRPGVIAALLTLALAVAAFALLYPWLQQRSQTGPPPLAQRKLSRLTFDPGLQSEPTWSPDGRMIAYSSNHSGNFDIRVQQVSGGKPIQVTTDAAHDWQPDWSADGSTIVFRSERDGGGLFMTPALGGDERKISSFGYRPRWSPDGSRILFTSFVLQNAGRRPNVYLVGLDGKPPREVLAEFCANFAPASVAWHPDGQRLSIWGEHNRAGWSFWTAPLAGGPPVKSELTAEVARQFKEAAVEFGNRLWVGNFQWAPSGRALYFEGVSQGVTNLWKVGVEPQTLRWVAGPERLTTGPGVDADIVISQDGRKLAYTTRAESTHIWSLPFDAATGQTKAAGQSVTPAGVDAWRPDLTRDGKKLVFVARRGEKEELWEKLFDENRDRLLAPADEFTRYSPRWSRDGQRLAYRRSRPTTPGSAQFEFALAWLPAGGGEEHSLTSAGPSIENPNDWSAEGEWVMVSSNRRNRERWEICLYPLAAAPRAETQMRVVASNPDYNLYQARLSPDQRWVCFNAVKASEAGASTIYAAPAEGGEWRRLTEGKYLDIKQRWAPDGRKLYFVSNRSGFLNVWGIRFDPGSGRPVGEPFRVTNYENPSQMVLPLIGSMELTLAADRLALPIMEVSGNIWVLENVDR
jgi:serine/threonine protein kinase